jgi:flagellar FliL protein
MADTDKKEQVSAEEAPPKKGGLVKWIIVGVAILLVLGGGGFVSWKTFLNPPAEESKEEAAPVTIEMGPTYPLETFIVNLAGAAGERYLKVRMELELKESSLVPQLEQRTPQIRDTVLLLLSSKTFDDIATFRGKTKLRNEITSRLNAVLPPASIKKIYFTEFVVQ